MTVDAAQRQSSWRRKSLSRVAASNNPIAHASLMPCCRRLAAAPDETWRQRTAVDIWSNADWPRVDMAICGSCTCTPAWIPRCEVFQNPRMGAHVSAVSGAFVEIVDRPVRKQGSRDATLCLSKSIAARTSSHCNSTATVNHKLHHDPLSH